ncbi:hypothetical protein [Shinella sp. BYT-45]|uniref:hypothetical protein n=1 Tax=Shinella sp. BYT-45 TaxID=3377377 RepID=UPI0039818EC7
MLFVNYAFVPFRGSFNVSPGYAIKQAGNAELTRKINNVNHNFTGARRSDGASDF